MKTFSIIILCLFLANGSFAQNSTKDKQVTKEAKKALQDTIDNIEYQLTKNMIDSMGFVLEANYMANRTGVRVPVASNLNFIKIDSSYVAIQTGNNTSMGSNGVGGVTAEGSVSQWKVSKDDKHRTFYITMEVRTNIGMYTVFMNVTSSGRATARLSGLWPGQLVWDGQLVSIGRSRTFKGRSS